MTAAQGIDQAKLEAFVGKGISDFGAALSSALVVIGDKLGLYRAHGRRRSVDVVRAGTAHRHHRALHSRLADQSGGRRLRRVRRVDRTATPCPTSTRSR